MISRVLTHKFAPVLSLGLTASVLFAHEMPVKGPPAPGHARPPLHINLTPATSVYYNPSQIQHAYGFDQLAADGTGQKIAIVDAYGNASIQNDLNTFCSQFGLSSTTVQILGNNTSTDTGWAMETALDVEWAHALAPKATIILSVAASSSISDLLNAVDAAVNAGATVVSMSWGGGEWSSMSSYDNHFNRAGVTFTASSGDGGSGMEWPAASPYVLAVGGTTLLLDSSNNRSSETAWSGSGGGTSSYYLEPSFQSGFQSSGLRGVPDVSYLADPNTGVLVFDSVNGGWFVVGGTSAGAPQWAALLALGNQLRVSSGASTLTGSPSTIYSLAKGSVAAPYAINSTYFYDITQGNNGGYTALPGYDYVTGLGSPLANKLVPALAPVVTTQPDFSLSATPSGQSVTAGGSTSYTVSVTPSGGFTGTVNLVASGFPAGASGSFSAASVTESGSTTLNISTAGTTPSGTYTVTITGTTGTLTHTTTVTLTVQAPALADFSLSVSPGSQVVKAGSPAYYTVTVTPTSTFTDTVYLSVSGLPAGATGSFSPASLSRSRASTLTISTANNGPRSTSTLKVTGSSNGANGTHTHSAYVSLRIH
jgi:subtilase family serine protease